MSRSKARTDTYCKNGVLQTERDRCEPRKQHYLEGLGTRDDAQDRPGSVALQERPDWQPGGQDSKGDMSYRYAEISREYNNRHAAHHAEQVAAGDDEEQVTDDDRERHHREQADEDDGDDPGVLMLDPVQQHLDVIPADEDYGSEEGKGRDGDRDVAYRVRADTVERYRRALGRSHSSLHFIYIDYMIHLWIQPSNIHRYAAMNRPPTATCS